jgi:hypothetical protein
MSCHEKADGVTEDVVNIGMMCQLFSTQRGPVTKMNRPEGKMIFEKLIAPSSSLVRTQTDLIKDKN